MSVVTEVLGDVLRVTLHRPEVRNAVDRATAAALAEAFRAFDADPELSVAVLEGAGGCFCAGADLKAFAAGEGNRIAPEGDGPLGCTRMLLSKPVIAAVEGPAVAGGLELALWCDLRVAARNATFGVFCRRFGVPLIDGGTVRLPRLIGHSRAMDMILTGRAVDAQEAHSFGLVNRLSEPGQSFADALELARQLARLPQGCLRSDRRSAYQQWDHIDPMGNEFEHGDAVLRQGDALEGARRFADGMGRHGQ